MEKNKEWLGYALFAVVLTAGLLYARFPSDVVLGLLQARADTADPPLALTVGRLRPSLRLGLRLEKPRVALREATDRILFQADTLLIRLRPLSLFGGKTAYSFNGDAYGGDIHGYVGFDEKESIPGMETEIQLENIHVEEYSYLAHLLGSPVQGTLGGTITCAGPSGNPVSGGSGNVTLKVVDGRVVLEEPFMTIETIEFKEMDIELVLEQGRVDVSRIEFRGDQMKGSLSGTILLKDELVNSNLNLKGTIEPFAAFFESSGSARDTVAFFKQRLKQGPIPFVIQGTLKAPEVKFT